VEGDFTTALAKAVGCDFESKKAADGGMVVTPPVNKTLPRIMVDGPFGTCSEEFLNFETVLLVGAGIGVTPFASYVPSSARFYLSMYISPFLVSSRLSGTG
jgi:NADPH oxidase